MFYFHILKRNHSKNSAVQSIAVFPRDCNGIIKTDKRALKKACHLPAVLMIYQDLIRNLPIQKPIAQPSHQHQIQSKKCQDQIAVLPFSVHHTSHPLYFFNKGLFAIHIRLKKRTDLSAVLS